MTTEQLPETMTKADFARHLGAKPGYVSQLNQAGRLVMSDDGKLVMVAESLQRIAETRDPGRSAVAARHAAARGEPLHIPEQDENGAKNAFDAGLSADSDRAGNLYQQSKAINAKYQALSSKLDYETTIGKMLVAADVRQIIAGAFTILRARLESLPDILAPQLAAEPDEQRCKAAMRDQLEHALTELSRQFAKLEKSQ
jgi:hypothetical protein